MPGSRLYTSAAESETHRWTDQTPPTGCDEIKLGSKLQDVLIKASTIASNSRRHVLGVCRAWHSP